ncbi:MAG: PepSY domain-containing protein [Nitrospiraceae bacterium]
MKKEIVAVGLTLVFGATVAPAWAMFETDRALSEKATVSMVDAIKTAEAAKPGKTVEVDMGKDDGRVVYKIEIVDGKKTHKVYVDAMTGKIHEIK